MGLAQVLERSAEDAWKIKEYLCRKGPHDIRKHVLWFRGDESVALASILIGDREPMLEVAGIGTYGFNADAVAILTDAWIQEAPTHPEIEDLDAIRKMSDEEYGEMFRDPATGRTVEYGELNRRAEQGEEMRQTIMVSAVSRAGYLAGSMREYRYAGPHLVWSEPRNTIDDMGIDATGIVRGEIPAALIRHMNAPTMQHAEAKLGIELDQAKRDVLTRGVIHSQRLPARVVLLPAGADHLRVLRENGLLTPA